MMGMTDSDESKSELARLLNMVKNMGLSENKVSSLKLKVESA
jgi:hypothetical protein